MIVSILNDVIGPVMRGPSSSHCAAALRIGRLARDLMDGEFDDVLVQFDRINMRASTELALSHAEIRRVAAFAEPALQQARLLVRPHRER